VASRPPAPNLAGALAAMGKTTRGPGRPSPVPSPVYQWLEINYDGLAAAFRRASPSWTSLADYLSEHGVTGAEGRRPSPVAVRAAMAQGGQRPNLGRSCRASANGSFLPDVGNYRPMAFFDHHVRGFGPWWLGLDPGGGGYPTLAIAGREGRIVIPRSSTLTLASG
jgi:hypothetical protein